MKATGSAAAFDVDGDEPVARTFNLADLFEVVAEAAPRRIAFIRGLQRLSYRQLDRRATRLASTLRRLGIGRGDHLGIMLHNSAEYLETFLACCKIGAAPVNVNYRYGAAELLPLFASLDLKALVYEARFDDEVLEVAERVASLSTVIRVGEGRLAGTRNYECVIAAGDNAIADPRRSGQDPYLVCTGGATGLPKAVAWSHEALFMAALGGGRAYLRCPPLNCPEELGPLVAAGEPLTMFAVAPMMHGSAMWAALTSLFSGHAVVVNDRARFDPTHVWDIVAHERVNIMSVVGDAMAAPLAEALEAHPGRWDLSQLISFGNEGAVLSGHLQARLKALLPHVAFHDNLASSEMGVVGSGRKPEQGGGCLMLPAGPQLAVIDAQRRIATEPGAQGMLACTGHTPLGYYGDAGRNAETFVTAGGRRWMLSGDRARIDEQGRIVVLGRASQCIDTGREQVFPEEVEEALRRCPIIRDVLVVGLPDARGGRKVAAVVELRAGAVFSAADFRKVCDRHLSGGKVPRAVFLVDAIRRSPAGKPDYRWAARHAAQASSVI